ncbi:MAG: radical SAM protein [Clostridia bacterium]|nr:radical SAM protein [Clostridia bacterium]
MPSTPYIARAALHMWEEPTISGTRGSGTVFFTGCSLGCIYCQNREISRGERGKAVSTERLAEIYIELMKEGAHNINLVTPTHYVPSVIDSVALSRERGMTLPIVYNTSSYDTVDTIRMLESTVDIYLPDLKYYKSETASRLSFAKDYREVALAAIAEMVRQKPRPVIEDGIMKSGVVVRILLLPAHLAEAKLNLKYLYDTYGDSIYISLMSQYTPTCEMPPPLNRAVTRAEYRELVDYAISLGVTNAFTQEHGSVGESFIPNFDGSGV